VKGYGSKKKKHALIKEDRRCYKFGSQEHITVECLHNAEEMEITREEKSKGWISRRKRKDMHIVWNVIFLK
jgi:hypothetical protein